MSLKVDITIGVLNYNPSNNLDAQDKFCRCLDSLKQNLSKDLVHEIYIIDQASNEHKQRDVISQYINENGWRSIFLEKNVGISRAINLLARCGRGKYICLVTSDVLLEPNLDKDLMNELIDNPSIWQICPASDNASSEYQRVGYMNGGLAIAIAQELTIQMWPREVFEKIGYFDERWKACYENLDFGLRIYLAGGLVAVSHNAFCHHELGMSIKTGARNNTYDDYIFMPNGFNQDILHAMWHKKWNNLESVLPWSGLYSSQIFDSSFNGLREKTKQMYLNNLYLPYVQSVGY
jgi:GT2 family glycosyltransferase